MGSHERDLAWNFGVPGTFKSRYLPSKSSAPSQTTELAQASLKNLQNYCFYLNFHYICIVHRK